jgi:uncharacterized protein YegJ (DUF2314 family)
VYLNATANLARMFPQNPGSSKRTVLAVAALILSLSAGTFAASEFQMLSNEVTRNNNTKVGARYRDQFMNAIDRAIVRAMAAGCAKGDAVERAELIFIVSADGRINRVLSSPGIAYGQCIASKLELPKTVPRPPRDNWPVAFLVAYNNIRPGPKDTPRRLMEQQAVAYDKAIAPYIAKARATYPAAKKRFLEGLPPGYSFSVWVRLFQNHAPSKQLRHEDVFVEVESIKNGLVYGRVNNKIGLLTNYKEGQRISVKESEVKNWLILRPDGVEEGNYVGKFLDHYKP